MDILSSDTDQLGSAQGRRRFLAVLGAASLTACGSSSPANDTDAERSTDATDATDATDVTPGSDVSTVDAARADAGETDGGTCSTGNPYGPVSAYPLGTYMLASMPLQIIIGRDSGGLYAYSACCTHTCCTVPAPTSASAISVCPCHLSQYNSNGVVQPGSVALRNLSHFALAVCDDVIYVDQFTIVPETTRWVV